MHHKVAVKAALALLVSVSLLPACRVRAPASDAAATGAPVDRAWVNKAAQALLQQGGLSAQDPLFKNPGADKGKIVDQLMADARFIDTVLDFNMYFLGFKAQKLYTYVADSATSDDGEGTVDLGARPAAQAQKPQPRKLYDDTVFELPNAISAARAVAENGDYFSLFAYEQPFYTTMTFDKRFGKHIDKAQTIALLSELQNTIHGFVVKAEGAVSDAAARSVCQDLSNNVFNGSVFLKINQLNLPRRLFSQAISSGSARPCSLQTAQTLPSDLGRFEKGIESLARFAARVKDDEVITSVIDLSVVDRKEFGDLGKSSMFGTAFFGALPNSSTNFNRRRGAYILKTYFCDDMTPINIAQPKTHAKNKHASDAGCAACHYKLDPMGGFFRTRGGSGTDYAGMSVLVFDDGAQKTGKELDAYFATWRASPDSGRTWNVGYVRSPVDPTQNAYGESLADLSRILRESPEVRQCLTRRLAGYFLGTNVTLDGDWLKSLAQHFEVESTAPGASSAALKAVVKEIILSKTFATPDPVPGQCYDLAPNAKPSSVPCAVGAILRENCISCHQGRDAPGGLDLSRWQQGKSGAGGFVHEAGGHAVSPADTFAAMKSRIASNDEDFAMPLGKFMNPIERETLYKWLDEQLEKAKGH